MTATSTLYGQAEFITATGLTERQVDYWTRAGVLRPLGRPTPGSGRRRLYDHDEVLVGRVARAVLAVGIGSGRDLLAPVIREVRDRLLDGDLAEGLLYELVPGVLLDLAVLARDPEGAA